MKKIINIYSNIMAYIGILGLIGFIAAVLVQVVSRTFLPTTPNWTEEAARFLFIFMVGFAGNAAVIKDEYVGVDLLLEIFPKKMRKTIRLLTMFVIMIFSGIVFYFCVVGPKGLLAMTPPRMMSTAMEIHMKYIYTALIILFGFYVVSFAMRIYLMLSEKGE